jgi:two-component system response regulator YesN
VNLDSIEEIEIWCKCNAYDLIEKVEKCSNKGYDILNKVIEHICRNFNKNITLESVADEIGLTPQYLSKIFKEKFGINFIDFITQKRMEYAEKLLRESGKNIKEIGKLAGYEDSNYFCKIFKKEMGTSPKQFRTKATTGV